MKTLAEAGAVANLLKWERGPAPEGQWQSNYSSVTVPPVHFYGGGAPDDSLGVGSQIKAQLLNFEGVIIYRIGVPGPAHIEPPKIQDSLNIAEISKLPHKTRREIMRRIFEAEEDAALLAECDAQALERFQLLDKMEAEDEANNGGR
jgi:hypothetical protein